MLQSFVLFPKLPIELQYMIWEIALSNRRIFSGENCFREWWYGRIVPFLSPVALHVCHSSRSLAKNVLRCTSIRIPGLPGWRVLYINQACDSFSITKIDVNTNVQISDFIADPTLVDRVVITGIASDNMWLKKDMMHYFDQFSALKEVVLANRGYPDYWSQSENMSQLVQQIQELFKDRERNVIVGSSSFDGSWDLKVDQFTMIFRSKC